MGKMPPPTEHGKGCLLPNDGLNSSVPADCALGLVIGTRSSAIAEGPRAVSYTHLTLPTIYSV